MRKPENIRCVPGNPFEKVWAGPRSSTWVTLSGDFRKLTAFDFLGSLGAFPF